METAPQTPLVELIDVTVGALNAVRKSTKVTGVNWNLCPGDYWVIGALTGGGKSDLLATAAGVQKPLSGFHFLFGRDAAHLNESELVRERLKIGLVFENGGRLFTQLTVAENLALPICYHQNCSPTSSHDRVSAALELTGLTRYADQKPAAISRNLHQRIGLARALALNPEVLLIDNPLMGIDPREAYWWLEFLSKLSAGHIQLGGRKITLAVATNDLRPWVDQGRQFALINKRSWHVVGDREGLKASRDPITRELLAQDFAEA
jgi:putative ABC transport system ATP-binding protein